LGYGVTEPDIKPCKVMVIQVYIASLSSSSTYGNAYVVWGDSQRPVLIDCGLSLSRMVNALKELGMKPDDLEGLFITHEHKDHVRAMCLKTPIAQKFGIPVYASLGFWNWYNAYYRHYMAPALVRQIQSGQEVRLSGFRLRAFSKPHDACEPLGFIVESRDSRACFVMDLGYVSALLETLMRGAEYFIFEANHDVEMELNSGRPPSLVKRVLGKRGHLSNAQAADSLSKVVTKNTKEIVLAHLSIDCNTPEKAVGTIRRGLKRQGLNPLINVAPPYGVAIYGK